AYRLQFDLLLVWYGTLLASRGGLAARYIDAHNFFDKRKLLKQLRSVIRLSATQLKLGVNEISPVQECRGTCARLYRSGICFWPLSVHRFSQPILISFSSGLNSGSPVTSSAFFSFASAAAKASAKLILKRALKSAAVSANGRVVE